MFERKTVKISSGSKISDHILEFSTTEPWELRLLNESDGITEYSCKGYDLFECLAKLRVQYLEPRRDIILCKGARIDVYPSRMSSQMSGGRKAYLLRFIRLKRTLLHERP